MKTQVTLTDGEIEKLLEVVRAQALRWADATSPRNRSQDNDLHNWHMKEYEAWRRIQDKLERAGR